MEKLERPNTYSIESNQNNFRTTLNKIRTSPGNAPSHF